MCTGTPKYNWRKNSLIVIIDNQISKMVSLKFCGPKLSAGCTLLSIWGVIQLGLMGLLFRIKSVALVEDVKLNTTEKSYHVIRQVLSTYREIVSSNLIYLVIDLLLLQ